MTYKLEYFYGWVKIVDNGFYLDIYDPLGVVTPDWPEGHWYEPRDSVLLATRGVPILEDYLAHKEEYHAEAKKLLVKEML